MFDVLAAAFTIIVIGAALGIALAVCMFIAVSAMEIATRFWDRN